MQISNRESFFPESFLNPLPKVDNVSEVTFDHLPLEIFSEIASHADFDTLKTLLEVSKLSTKVVSSLNEKRREAVKEIPFGKEEWSKFFGLDIGNEPMLPRDIEEILNSPDHMDPTKKVSDTHIFTLIPRESLKSLGQLANKYFMTEKGYGHVKKAPNEKSYWALMSRKILNGTKNATGERHLEMVSELAQIVNVKYEVPGVLEAAVSILTHYVRSGEYLFSSEFPLTLTHCLEKVDGYHLVVGAFNSGGMRVYSDPYNARTGVAALRRFRPLVLG